MILLVSTSAITISSASERPPVAILSWQPPLESRILAQPIAEVDLDLSLAEVMSYFNKKASTDCILLLRVMSDKLQ